MALTRARSLWVAAALAMSMGGALAQQAPDSPPQVVTEPPAAPAAEAPAVPLARQPPVAQPDAAPAQTAPDAPPTEAGPAAPATGAAPGTPLADRADPDAAPAATEAGADALPHDLSPWGMFLAADLVVKSVMIGLVAASLITWTIWIAKTLELLVAKARLRRALAVILAAPDLDAAERALDGRRGPGAAMTRAARAEAGASVESLADAGGQGLLGRVASHLGRIEAQAGRRLAIGTGLLATTNLAVVAPGIAEALLATALGLVAAIPAVVIYNVFARATAGYRALLGDAAAAVERLVSRDLDQRRLAPAALARAAE